VVEQRALATWVEEVALATVSKPVVETTAGRCGLDDARSSLLDHPVG
jgi:hypothetical protein